MDWKDDTVSLFPMFVKLEGRDCLVVGAGTVAEGKIRSLLEAGARVTVVAPRATEAVHAWARAAAVRWQARSFVPEDVAGMFLVVAATNSVEVNRRVFAEARQSGVLCNAVDDPEYCDFYYPSVVRRGDLQIAISTAGHSPALAQRLRRELEQQFPLAYADWLDELGQVRRRLLAADPDVQRRRRQLHRMASGQSFARFLGRKTRRGEP